MVTSLFNLYGGSGGGVTEEKVLQLIKSNGAPILVEYNDIDTELGLEIYNNPEKYGIAYGNNFYTYVKKFGVNKAFAAINLNYPSPTPKIEIHSLFIKEDGSAYVTDTYNTIEVKTAKYISDNFYTKDEVLELIKDNGTPILVEYDDIDTELGLEIYTNHPEKYIVKHNNLLYRFEEKDSNSVGFIAKSISSAGGNNIIRYSEYYFAISNTGEKTEIEIWQSETYNKNGVYNKDEIDNKIGNIEILLSEI